jgi:hypothetical protein
MTLQGFTEIQAGSTSAGSAITSVLADAFRTNDILFEKVAQALLASPFVPNGSDGDPADADIDARKFLNARNLVMGTNKVLTAGVPLVWFARERIVINAKLDAMGKGASPGQSGDFGGSGGGIGGGDCRMPFSTDILVQNGADAETLAPAEAWRISRSLMYLPHLKGGAGGPALNGGSGGGVVCLCAPIIEIGSVGLIDASGADGANGGGGGGLVILIANSFLNVNTNMAPLNVLVNGGGGGHAGGSGRIMRLEFQ